MSLIFKSHGKLLITGEYFILKGAKALCIPTNYYQSLKVNEIDENILKWKSFDNNKNLWLQAEFLLSDLTLLTKPTNEVLFLQKLLLNIKKFNSKLLNLNIGYDIESSMNFNKEWGLGSSSTLISNLSKWAKIDPFDLLWSVSNGSGYDIASSIVNKPILYQLNNKKPEYSKIKFYPSFHENLFFIYRNNKQKTNIEIDYFNKHVLFDDNVLDKISSLTKKIIDCKNLLDFQKLIINHEKILSTSLNKKTIKEELFIDYPGEIKSLGAWGGDFILAAGPSDSNKYFEKKGFKTVIRFMDMLKKS